MQIVPAVQAEDGVLVRVRSVGVKFFERDGVMGVTLISVLYHVMDQSAKL